METWLTCYSYFADYYEELIRELLLRYFKGDLLISGDNASQLHIKYSQDLISDLLLRTSGIFVSWNKIIQFLKKIKIL